MNEKRLAELRTIVFDNRFRLENPGNRTALYESLVSFMDPKAPAAQAESGAVAMDNTPSKEEVAARNANPAAPTVPNVAAMTTPPAAEMPADKVVAKKAAPKKKATTNTKKGNGKK